MEFQQLIRKAPRIITEGAIVERLRRSGRVRLDPNWVHAGLIYEEEARNFLRFLYEEYIDIARRYALPILLATPTWRANREHLAASGWSVQAVNRDNSRFLQEIGSAYADFKNGIFIGGLLGCKGDAYRPEEALTETEAETFHAAQIEALAGSGLDYLMAATLPALSEAKGIARVLARHSIPYILSFIIRPSGRLLDNTALETAILEIDNSVHNKPVAYFVNCVHPDVLHKTLAHSRQRDILSERLIGIQGNASGLSPEELDCARELHTSDPEDFADRMLALYHEFGIKVLGGCCGTDKHHMEQIARGFT